jgi:hypothetical protein
MRWRGASAVDGVARLATLASSCSASRLAASASSGWDVTPGDDPGYRSLPEAGEDTSGPAVGGGSPAGCRRDERVAGRKHKQRVLRLLFGRAHHPGRTLPSDECTGQTVGRLSRYSHFADLFPNGKVLSSPLDHTDAQGPAAFPLVRGLMVGATGFEPVTSSVSAKSREPLCGRPFMQVTLDRKGRGKALSSRSVKCSLRAPPFRSCRRTIRPPLPLYLSQHHHLPAHMHLHHVS